MSEWQPIETAPKDGTRIWVAYHSAYGSAAVQVVSWSPRSLNGQNNWDYINSHDGDPKWWMPYVEPEPPPVETMEGPDCGCDYCTEKYARPDNERES